VDHLKTFMGTSKEALETAMGFEKDTIMFFLEMREFVPDGEKKHIQACIDEERSHLRLLAGNAAEIISLLILKVGPRAQVRGPFFFSEGPA
jgi:hypothetical protein